MPTDTFAQLQPYLDKILNGMYFCGGLLMFIAVYIVLKDLIKFIKSFIDGGMV